MLIVFENWTELATRLVVGQVAPSIDLEHCSVLEGVVQEGALEAN